MLAAALMQHPTHWVFGLCTLLSVAKLVLRVVNLELEVGMRAARLSAMCIPLLLLFNCQGAYPQSCWHGVLLNEPGQHAMCIP